MNLFTAAMGGVGEAAQGMAQTWIKEESAGNLAKLQAELDQKKAQTIADLQRRRDDYLVSPEYAGRAATAAGTIKSAEDAAQTRTTSPGQTLVKDGKETYANPNETAAELNYSLYEQGFRAGGGARATSGSGAGTGKAPEDEKTKQTRIDKATQSIRGTAVGDQVGSNPRALAAFQEIVANNPEVAPAQAAIDALDAINSEDPEYVKKNPNAARQTQRIEFDDAGKAWVTSTITGDAERSRGKARKPATDAQVVNFVESVLAPRAATTAPGANPAFDNQVRMALRAAKMTPDQFAAMVESIMGDRESKIESGRLSNTERELGSRQPLARSQRRMGETQQPGGTVINPLTGQPAALATRRQ